MPVNRASNRINRFSQQARALGCSDLIRLGGEATAAHLEYLDLMPGRYNAPLLPDAVAEFQGHPLLYLVDRIDEADQPGLEARQVQDLQMLLANRSEHACLGVVRPGSLEVYPINLDRKTLAQANFRTIQIAHPEAPTFFQSLATGSFDIPGRPKQADYVFETIHALLTKASEDLAGTTNQPGPMHGLDVLSTTGRALFFRFLIDRGIVLPSELSQISPQADELQDVFSSPEKAAATSCWLDETFNGDLLPLVNGLDPCASTDQKFTMYDRFYKEMGQATGQHLFGHLQAILRGWKHGGGSNFQSTFEIDWDDFNFAHIPIGVLSQVYETFSRQWDERQSQESSVYYTPRNIARLLVEEAFAALENPAEAMVLDPACGAGAFLVLAFRQLIRKCWEKAGRRPDTPTIQRILYKQLRGFEVTESALRLSALALYISAIEFNGTPRPPRSLKFPRPLRDEVLFNFGHHKTDPKWGFVLGSLGSDVPVSFNHCFDIVVTNPPWTRLRASSENALDKANEKVHTAEMNGEFTRVTRRALGARGLDTLARHYTNPDNNPDLPFLWRATEWARPNGIIAMALPGRIILKQSGKGKAARDTIMQGLAVTGILNGSDLEKTAVWPHMNLPFMLLFARNSLPKSDHHFHFVTPIRENHLSGRGQFRVDYQAAESVAAQAVIENPCLLKTLAVGTILDFEVVEKIQQHVPTTLGEFWSPPHLESGVGYKLAPNLPQQPANSLFNLLDFEPSEAGFQIEYKALQLWRDRFFVGDITNLPSFVGTLLKRSDAISIFLWNQLTEYGKNKLIQDSKLALNPEDLQVVLVRMLNKTMVNQPIYDQRRFQAINLSPETLRLLEQDPHGQDLFHLNRLLLEDAYPTELARNPRKTVHSAGRSGLYQAPLLIIPQTPGETREEPKAFLSSTKPLCFSQSYYGYSAHGHEDGKLLTAMLYLVTHSLLFQHFCLAHSSRIGASYRTVVKEDLEAFPFPNPAKLTETKRRRILMLAEGLETLTTRQWDEIDDFVFSLYGLDEHDATVVRDTITVCGPYRAVREFAEEPPSTDKHNELEVFRRYLEEMLQPLFQVARQSVTVTVQPLGAGEWNPPWRFLSITLTGDSLPDMRKLLPRLMADANKTGASRIVLRIPNGGLLVGILNQRRFWTRSRARLCSLHIEEHHLDAFRGPTQ
jgi:hypothetical protein